MNPIITVNIRALSMYNQWGLIFHLNNTLSFLLVKEYYVHHWLYIKALNITVIIDI